MRYGFLLFLTLATQSAQAQWQILPTPTTASLRGIHALGQGVAWASGTEGTVLRTTDDGKTWQRCPTPPAAEKLDFRGIQAFDAQTAIVMSSGKGDLSRLYKTTDACQTWKLIFTNPDPEGFWDDMVVLSNHQFVLILGDPVRGSMTVWQGTIEVPGVWNRFRPQGLEIPPDTGAFAASNSGLMIVDEFITPAFVTGGPQPAFFWYPAVPGPQPNTWHPGKFWLKTPIPIAKGPTAGGFSIAHAGDLELPGPAFTSLYPKMVIVGGDYQKPALTSGTAAFTVDGGKTWLPAQTPPHGFRSAVAYDPTVKTWITVGPNGTDISTDDGRNWRALKPTPTDPPDADQNWNALSLPFAVGPHGRIGKLRPDALSQAKP